MDLLWVKILTMALLGGISLAVGLLPLFMRGCIMRNKGKESSWANLCISALSCFGGGVILSTCLTHMLPELNIHLQMAIDQGNFPDTGK